jgi:hypothetical protein
MRSEPLELSMKKRSSLTSVLSGAPRSPPIGNELVQSDGIDHRTGEYVSADFRPFFQHADRDVGARRDRQLLEADGRRETGRSAADDHHVKLHRLALDLLGFHGVPSPFGSTLIAPVIVDRAVETIPRLRQKRCLRRHSAVST